VVFLSACDLIPSILVASFAVEQLEVAELLGLEGAPEELYVHKITKA